MKDLVALLVSVTVWAMCAFGWVYGLFYDAKAGNVIWFLVDLFAPPIGVIRGLCLWLF